MVEDMEKIFSNILLVFGLNSGNTFLNKFFTGISSTVLSLSLYQISVSLFNENKLIIVLFKCFLILTIVSSLISYCLLKCRLSKISSFYEELDLYQKKVCLKSQYFWLIVTIIVFLLKMYLVLNIVFQVTFINDIFESISLKNRMNISKSVVIFYCIGFFMVNQLIYIQFNSKYFNINENYLNSLKDKNSSEDYKPSKEEIISAQQTIHQFIHFQTLLDKCIECLNNLIIFSNITLILSQILLLLFDLGNHYYKNILSRILIILILTLYFTTTQFWLSVKRRIPHKIFNELNKWQRFENDWDLTIELQVLLQTAKLFQHGKLYHNGIIFNDTVV